MDLFVRPDGTVQAIYADDLVDVFAALGVATTRRASHVEPYGNGGWMVDLSPVARACTKCARIKPIEQFDLRDNGKRRRRVCHECFNAQKTRHRRKRHLEHPDVHDRVKRISREYRRNVRVQARLGALNAYSDGDPKCACCGERTVEFLTIDHINGNGAAHRRELEAQNVGPGTGFYLWLKSNGYPNGFQVLCYNCNCAKGCYGTCPHKSGPTLGPFATRQAALDAEVAWLDAALTDRRLEARC